MYSALKGEVAARGLAKLEARVCTSSCLDQCATGVTVLVEPDHFFYGRVTVADVPEIVDGLVKGQPVKRLMVTAVNTMELDGMSDIEGKTAREAASKCGQRASFKT